MALTKIIIAMLVLVAPIGVINGFTLPEQDISEYNPYIYAIANEDQQGFNDNQEYDNGLIELHRAKRQGSVSVEAERQRGQGTRLNVEGQGRIWTGNNGRSTLDGTVNYSRQFGGHQGGRNRDYGAGVQFRHRF